MSSTSLPDSQVLPFLLLVEPQTVYSIRAVQLGRRGFRVTQTDCARDLFQMRNLLRFAMAVLSDELGATSLRAVAESVRRQWPGARILILGHVPISMEDHLYDQVAPHSADEDALLSTLDRLMRIPSGTKEHRRMPPPAATGLMPATRARALRESDPTKLMETTARDGPGSGQPSDRYRPHRRGYYAFPPAS